MATSLGEGKLKYSSDERWVPYIIPVNTRYELIPQNQLEKNIKPVSILCEQQVLIKHGIYRLLKRFVNECGYIEI